MKTIEAIMHGGHSKVTELAKAMDANRLRYPNPSTHFIDDVKWGLQND